MRCRKHTKPRVKPFVFALAGAACSYVIAQISNGNHLSKLTLFNKIPLQGIMRYGDLEKVTEKESKRSDASYVDVLE
jgi:hypothetical protein